MQPFLTNFSSFGEPGERDGSHVRVSDAPHPADADLTASLHRLHELRMAALTGGHYDADEFDDAVLAFRSAWEEDTGRARSDQRRVA